jgi:hypothetical protein
MCYAADVMKEHPMQEIERILGEILEKVDDKDKQRLAQAIEDFADKHPRAWKRFSDTPFAGMLDVLVMGSEAMPGIQAHMRMMAAEEEHGARS